MRSRRRSRPPLRRSDVLAARVADCSARGRRCGSGEPRSRWRTDRVVTFGADDRGTPDTALFPACGRGPRSSVWWPNAGSCRHLRPQGVMTTQLDDRQERVLLDAPLLMADEVAALLAVPRSSVYEYARRLHDPL